MALGHYEGPGEVYFNGRLLAEAESVRFRIMGNKRKVFTMIKGLAGRSKGPVEAEIQVTNAMPIAGEEAEFERILIEDGDIRLVVLHPGGVKGRKIVDALYQKHVKTVEQVGGISNEEFATLNKSLHRLERFWTDQILYRL